MKNYFAFICFVFLLSCRSESLKVVSSGIKEADIFPGECPYLTKNNLGQPVLSWVRMVNDSSAIFCYATSDDGGLTFCNTIVVSSSKNIHAHSENLPKIIFKSTGEIIAVWGANNVNPINKYSGLIYFAQSFDNGKTWGEAKRLVEDTAGYDQRYSDLALLKNGEVGIMWLDNRKTNSREGSAVYFASTEGKNGFMHERMISQSACQCCRSSLFADRKGNIHALYRGIINDSIRDMVHLYSVDGGKTFGIPQRIHKDNWVLRGCPHTGPAMTENKSGLHFAWYTGGNNKGSFYTGSTDNGNTFINYGSISGGGSHPQLSAMPDDKIVIVWDEYCEKKDGLNKSIGIQLRTADGREIIKDIITPDSLYTTYPVVLPMGDTSSVIAYCVKKLNKNHISFQHVNFKND